MRIPTINAGQSLRFVFAEPAVVHWGIDDWQHPQDTATVLSVLGLQVVDLASEALAAGQRLLFSIQDVATGNWFENDRVIEVVSGDVVGQGTPAAAGHIDREAAD
jgi:glucoamylase